MFFKANISSSVSMYCLFFTKQDASGQKNCLFHEGGRYLLKSADSSRDLQSSAIITNGIIKLGVRNSGNLNVPGGVQSVQGSTLVGLRFLTGGLEFDSTVAVCPCEGWGASAVRIDNSVISGFASTSEQFPGKGLTVQSFTFDGTSATSIVTAGGGNLQITHSYSPATESPNLYKGVVTYKNTADRTLTNLVRIKICLQNCVYF